MAPFSALIAEFAGIRSINLSHQKNDQPLHEIQDSSKDQVAGILKTGASKGEMKSKKKPVPKNE